MNLPSQAGLAAATAAARQFIANYSEFDSSMIPDDVLTSAVENALIAYLNVQPPKGQKP